MILFDPYRDENKIENWIIYYENDQHKKLYKCWKSQIVIGASGEIGWINSSKFCWKIIIQSILDTCWLLNLKWGREWIVHLVEQVFLYRTDITTILVHRNFPPEFFKQYICLVNYLALIGPQKFFNSYEFWCSFSRGIWICDWF